MKNLSILLLSLRWIFQIKLEISLLCKTPPWSPPSPFSAFFIFLYVCIKKRELAWLSASRAAVSSINWTPCAVADQMQPVFKVLQRMWRLEVVKPCPVLSFLPPFVFPFGISRQRRCVPTQDLTSISRANWELISTPVCPGWAERGCSGHLHLATTFSNPQSKGKSN